MTNINYGEWRPCIEEWLLLPYPTLYAQSDFGYKNNSYQWKTPLQCCTYTTYTTEWHQWDPCMENNPVSTSYGVCRHLYQLSATSNIYITANWDIAQKNGFHFHNLFFVLNLILQWRVHSHKNYLCWAYKIIPSSRSRGRVLFEGPSKPKCVLGPRRKQVHRVLMHVF